MVLHWSLSDKSPLVSGTLLGILAHLNNAAVSKVSVRPLISKFSSSFNNPWVTVLKASIIIGVNVTFMFHSFFFFNSLARSRYLSFFSFSFSFYVVVSWDSKIHNFASSLFFFFFFFLLIIIRSVLLAAMRWSACMSKSHFIIIIIIINTPWEVFTLALTGGFSLEYES